MKKTITTIGAAISSISMLTTAGLFLYGCNRMQESALSADPSITLQQGVAACTKVKDKAQSIMIDIQGPKTFVRQDSLFWDFDDHCAIPYYTIPVSSGNDSADALAIASAAIEQKCAFWTGNTSRITSHNCNGNIVMPSGLSIPAPRTCWKQDPSYGPKATVTYVITLASESYVVTEGKNDGKYTFKLSNADGKQRKTNLTVTLTNSATGQVIQVDNPNATVVKGNKKANNCLLDYKYYGNAGSNGDPSSLQSGTMGAILSSDAKGGNDDGCGATAIAVADPITYTLGDGTYVMKVTGTLKGLDGSVDTDINGSTTITVLKTPNYCTP